MGYLAELLPKWPAFKLSKAGLMKVPRPTTLTFSITSMCQSRCKSCNIGLVFSENPEMRKKDLRLDEIEQIFKSLGHVFFFNISGGEPFLRQDIPQIVELACKYLTPKVIHTPTNALQPEVIEKRTREIMEIMKANGCADVPFTIKPSFDGIGEQHDYIRGVKGNFEKLMETVRRLKELKKEYPNLRLGLGTVVSKLNVHDIERIAKFADAQNVDSYINEVAEERTEMFNLASSITPSWEEYQKAMEYFKKQIREDLKKRKQLERATQSFRLVYYDITTNILKKKTQVIPCYGGITNVHINAMGEVWPCCVLGYSKPLGNLRKENYDFWKVWHSKQAADVRKFIHNKGCACPLANQYYSNILMNVKSMFKVLKNMIFT